MRHSFALRWYSVGRLAYEQRFAHLNAEEQKDFREQFGDTWDLVATMLGRSNPQTTRSHYLEPFRALDVSCCCATPVKRRSGSSWLTTSPTTLGCAPTRLGEPGERPRTGAPVALPPAGFRPQQRLGGGQDRLVVRFVPEDGRPRTTT